MEIGVRNSTKNAIIDDEDIHIVEGYTLYVIKTQSGSKEYVGASKDTERHRLHRLILKPAFNMDVDHIDGDTFNNRRSNLRECTRAQNSGNIHIFQNKFKGVSQTPSGRFRARIKVDYLDKHLGYFATEEEAALAYNQAAIKYFEEFAHLNVIRG